MSHTVNQRTRELGLRIALGASARDLLQLIFTQGFFLTAAGVVVGSATALLLTRLIGALLYHVNSRDPIAFVSAFAVLTVTSIAAVLLPARRATKTDPASVLRE
jgi:putative ABC transport system permease protein